MDLLTRSDYQKMQDARLEEMVEKGPPKDAMSHIIRTSSGTTGGTPMVSVVQFPRRSVRRFLGSKRPAVFFGPLNARLANTLFYLDKAKEETVLLCVDPLDLNADTEPVLKAFKPDLLMGVPSYIMKTFAGFVGARTPLTCVKRIYLSGEFLGKHVFSFFKNIAPRARLSSWYAVTEFGPIGTNECGHLERNMYHLHPGVTAEIKDPDEEGVGELVVMRTSQSGRSSAKYLVGDLSRIIQKECPCGASRTIELFGRSRVEFVKVHGAQLHVEEFDRVLAENELYAKDYRVEVKDKKINGIPVPTITLKIEPTPLLMEHVTEPEKYIAELFSEHVFVTPSKKLKDVIEEGIVGSLAVTLCPEGFTFQNKTVKLQYIT